MSKSSDTNTMWGGRFSGGPSAIMEKINASIDFDKRFYAQDIAGSKAHCAMLVKQGILTAEDGQSITDGLDKVLAEIEAGEFKFSPALEDIHMNVENRLRELIGDAAGVCIRHVLVTIRWQRISVYGCVMPLTVSMTACKFCNRR